MSAAIKFWFAKIVVEAGIATGLFVLICMAVLLVAIFDERTKR